MVFFIRYQSVWEFCPCRILTLGEHWISICNWNKLYEHKTNIAWSPVYYKKQQLKISLKMWRHLFWQPFIDLTYADVFSMHTVCISFWACMLVTATWTVTETKTNRRIFLFTFSYLSVVLYTKITRNMNLRNILINMTKNKVSWNICRG